jgi:carboxymethylenebutenolidase
MVERADAEAAPAQPRRRSGWRIAGWVFGGIVALVLVLLGAMAISVAVDNAGSEERLESVANTVVPGSSGPDVQAYVARPDGRGPFPVVIMVHEFWGLNEDIVEKADLLAEEGYLVVAPDVFRGGSTGWIPSAIYQVSTTPNEEILEDLDAVTAWVETLPEADPDAMGIVGFCFGGRVAVLHSLHDPTLQATVTFYGNVVADPERLAALQGPVLGIFGEEDVSIPLEDVEAFEAALEEAGVEHEVTVYEGVGHAFVESVEGIEAGGAQGEAWAQMLGFLDEALSADDAEARAGEPQRADDPLPLRYVVLLGWSHLGHPSH